MYEDPTFKPAPASNPPADAAVNNSLTAVNARFNAALARQIAGTLPPGYVYQLGRPGRILLSAGIPDLPIEMASARLLHKSNQENHPFDLTEVRDLVTAIQAPLAVFRSATRLDSKVIMTELQHAGEKWCAKSNFVVAVRINKVQGKIRINSVRSVHYRSSNMHIINWINEDLADYIAPDFDVKWLDDIKKEFRSKPQYNSADVRTKLLMVAKIVQAADKSK